MTSNKNLKTKNVLIRARSLPFCRDLGVKKTHKQKNILEKNKKKVQLNQCGFGEDLRKIKRNFVICKAGFSYTFVDALSGIYGFRLFGFD